MPVPITSAIPTRWRTASALVSLATGALLLLGGFAQEQFGLFGQKEWQLPRAAKVVRDGKVFKAKLPPWGTGALAERKVVLLRHGKPVGMRVQHAKTVSSDGGGAYKIQHVYLYFSLPKDEDPREDIESLTLSLPRRVTDRIWVAGAALLLLGGVLTWRNATARSVLSGVAGKVESIPAWLLVAGILILGLWTALGRLPDAMAFSDTWFSVKGVPYSDAVAWDEVATHLAQGKGFSGGFSAQRPLYPTMLGLVYMATGQSLLAAKALNAVWLALAAAAVCALGIAGGSRIAGCAGGLAVLIGESYIDYSKLLMTETAGAVFGVASVLALAAAIERPGWWRIGTAGVLLACANLASGFAMFALAGYGAIALGAWWWRQGAKKALAQSAVLGVVVLLAWMPWMFRQHAVHGIWNLTDSGAKLMLSAAMGEGGQLTGEAGLAWKAAKVPNEQGARYKFDMARFREVVKADPMAYARTVVTGMGTFADYWKFRGPERIGVLLAGLMAAAVALLRRHSLLTVVVSTAVVTAACLMLEGATAKVMWPLAAILTLITCPRRQVPLWALVVVTGPFVALLCGMTGGNLPRRMWTACEWTMPLLLTVGGYGVMRMLAVGVEAVVMRKAPRHAEDTAVGSGQAGGHVAFISTAIAIVLVAHALAGSVGAACLYLMRGQDEAPPALVPDSVRTKALEVAMETFPFLKPIPRNDPRLWVHLCEFGEYACQLNGWEDAQHWARSFEVRPYARTVAFGRMPGSSGLIPFQMRAPPSEIPRGKPLLVIGVLNYNPDTRLGHDGVMVEVLGFVPAPNGDATWAEAKWLPFTRESFDILQQRAAQ
jgi:hypothetical protein